jgi:sugar phosphate isomerase/epimerase
VAAPHLSVQLYSVRDELAADLDGTLGRLASLGFRQVEAFDFVRRVPELAAAFARHGLSSPTAHAPLLAHALAGEGGTEAPAPDRILEAAAELGVSVVIDPMVAPAHWSSTDAVARVADAINAAAEAAAAHGLTVGYHNHSQEFHHSFDGVTAYETFVARLDPAVVLELDAYWAQVGRQDVPALLGRLGSRVTALHVKDGAVDVDPFLTEGPVDLGQVPAGTGAVPLDEVLAAATGLEYAVVEYDAYAGDIFEGIAATAAFLAERGIR